jgi:hypothetical protein
MVIAILTGTASTNDTNESQTLKLHVKTGHKTYGQKSGADLTTFKV